MQVVDPVKETKSRIQAAKMKYLRRVMGVTREDRMRNDKIRKELDIKPAVQFIQERQLS